MRHQDGGQSTSLVTELHEACEFKGNIALYGSNVATNPVALQLLNQNVSSIHHDSGHTLRAPILLQLVDQIGQGVISPIQTKVWASVEPADGFWNAGSPVGHFGDLSQTVSESR
jgi:hypothetical protein